MKKNYKLKTRLSLLLMCFMMMFAANLKAQVSAYSFSQSSGTFTPITGGAIVGTPTADDPSFGTLNIGFNFDYNGTVYTQFGLNTNGWISMGAATPTSSYTSISSGATNNIISALNADLQLGFRFTASRTLGSNVLTAVSSTAGVVVGDAITGTGIAAGTTITSFTINTITLSANATSTGTGTTYTLANGEMRYETLGLAPNRVCVVQWLRARRFGQASMNLEFQIRLYETSNVIEVVYGTITPNTTTSTYQIGLRGNSNADFNNRSTTTAWSGTTAGAVNTASCSMTASVFPSLGQTYTWTPPPPCSGTPTAGTTAGPAGACSAVNFTLSLTGATTGVSGITYQWQSSPDNITYTNIAATGATASVSQTAATYYQCIVTCSASGLSANSTPLFVPMNAVLSCYCSSIPTNAADEEITNVTVGTLNNTSDCTTPAPGTGSILSRYANYMSGPGAPAAPFIARTNPTSISVTVGSCGATNFNSGLAIFIDLNQNGSFADAGEKVYSNGTAANITCVPATIVNGIITIPMTANLGITAMRIIDAEGSSGNTITSCFSYGYGETEDYLINIVDLPPAPPTPTQSAGVPTCVSGTDLSVAGSPAPGDAWYWQTTATGTSTANSVSGAYTVFLNGTYYVRTYNAGYGFWSATSDSVVVANIPLAPLPPAPTAVTPACLTTSISVAPATGSTTYYWQGTTVNGTSTALDAATPFNATASGTYYVSAFDASTSCWSNTNGVTVVVDTYVPPTPTSTANPLNICINSTTGMINASAPSGSVTSSFGTSLISTGAPAVYNITVPALPAGATIISTQLQVIGATAVGGSWRSEIRVALSGSTTLAATQLSTLTSAGLITPDPSITVPNLPLAGGPVTLTLTETFDDGGTGVTDATFTEVRLVINYSIITWWDALTGGTQIGTGSPFESVGTSILPNTSTLGTYQFYAMASSGTCTSSRLTVDVIVNPLPIVTASAPSTVCAGAMVTLNGGGASTYVWDNGVTDNVPFAATGTTTYNVIGTDVNGCTNTASTVLTVNPLPVVSASSTAIACNGGTSTVTITATGGMPAYVGEGVYTQPAGTTVYVVTDANSCAGTASVVITEPAPLVASSVSTNILCNGGTSTVTISATGGTGAYSGTGTFTQSAGTTIYTVTDANSCVSTTSVTVTEPAILVVSSSETAILCNGGTSSVTISATGGTTAYSGTGTFPQSAGTTVYTVTDANSCSSTLSVTVTEPTVLTATSSATSIACFGGSSTVTVLPAGGTSPYTITGSPFTVPAGSYTYNVSDANGCTTTTSINITEPTELFAGSGATSVMCSGDSATVSIMAIGGTPAYSGTGSFMQAASQGSVSYTVMDANGCTATTNITVTEPAAIVATASATSILCNGDSATVTVSAAGGTGALTGTGSFPQAAGTTVYTVTDANGCIGTVSQTLTEPTAVMIMFSSTPVLCNGDSSAVTISAMGGTPGYTGQGTFNQAAGTVTYTVTDANGCVGTGNATITEPAAITATQTVNLCLGGSVTVGTSTYNTDGTYTDVLTASNTCDSTVTTIVIVNPLPVVTASVDNDTICSGNSVIFTGGGAVSYIWDNSVTDSVAFTPSLTGTTTYNVIGTDVNGCTNTASISVMVNALPSVTLSSFTAPVCLQAVPVTLTGGSPAGGTYTGTGVAAGMFDPAVAGVGSFPITYTVTDTNACTNSASSNITVLDCTGIDERASSDGVNVYPNPTIGIFNITINDANYNVLLITIVDIQGKVVFTSTEKNVSGVYTKQISLEEFSKGVYYIKVNADNNVHIKKLIVQ